jgi:hypothetical protein
VEKQKRLETFHSSTHIKCGWCTEKKNALHKINQILLPSKLLKQHNCLQYTLLKCIRRHIITTKEFSLPSQHLRCMLDDNIKMDLKLDERVLTGFSWSQTGPMVWPPVNILMNLQILQTATLSWPAAQLLVSQGLCTTQWWVTSIQQSDSSPLNCLIILQWFSRASFIICSGGSIFQRHSVPTGFVWWRQQNTHLLAHARLGVVSMQRWLSIP